MELEVGDIVICIVDRIVGTIVFVKLFHENREIEASIIISEIAPGRIRNLRDYVVPKKRIVCKVLRISQQGNIELSLRRVTQKDKKQALEREKQEKSYISVLKTILKEKSQEIINNILKTETIFEFIEDAKQNPKNIEKLIGKESSEKILTILKTSKQKKVIVKKEINLTSNQPNGIDLIKDILKLKDIEVKYISAGRYSLKTQAENPKIADNKLKEILTNIEKKSKKESMNFSIIQN